MLKRMKPRRLPVLLIKPEIPYRDNEAITRRIMTRLFNAGYDVYAFHEKVLDIVMEQRPPFICVVTSASLRARLKLDYSCGIFFVNVADEDWIHHLRELVRQMNQYRDTTGQQP
ncbi:hypothetical protein ECE50_030315 [Chitinophaga sp. Mgbs1]|uniref:Uncharacterized protein n=1 Tax=Chitinophaga solisilvae TaxID=1233460 RepID=A0A9Q5D7N0_9BACT|nr:hypothetical protein [Chitinophaga solisilvae]